MSRRRRPDESVHDYQHDLIDERVAAFRAAPRRSGLDKQRRRELYKRATWALGGHLRLCHGWHHTVGLPPTLDELEALHARHHAEESNA